MLLNLTEEQIIQLAPDAASVKAGKGLATRAKWVLLEHSDRAIWGHCQGRENSIPDRNRYKKRSIQMFLSQPEVSMQAWIGTLISICRTG